MKRFLFLVLLIIASGTAFAEGEDEESQWYKNTVTVDVMPLISSLIYVMVIDTLDSFGINAQYERQLTKKVSVAGRFEYKRLGIYGKTYDADEENNNIMSSISAEGHVRFYPTGDMFFLDGTLGYANFTQEMTLQETKNTAHYFKYGGKVGCKIDFNKPGGFVLEVGVGYFFAAELNKVEFYSSDYSEILNFMGNIIAKSFAGEGLQVSLCLGYKF